MARRELEEIEKRELKGLKKRTIEGYAERHQSVANVVDGNTTFYSYGEPIIEQSKKVQQQLEYFSECDSELENELDYIEEQADSLIKTIGQTLLSAKRFEEAMLRFGRKTRGEED